jgi:hypothetical protein
MGRYRELDNPSLLVAKLPNKAIHFHIPITHIRKGSNTTVTALTMVLCLNPLNIPPYSNHHQDPRRRLAQWRSSLEQGVSV